MTKEESIMMWNLEKSNLDQAHITKGMKKLYARVDELINQGLITYEDFTGDVIDMLTTVMVASSKQPNLDRADMVDDMCNRLIKKYETEHSDREPVAGDKELSEDTKQLQDKQRVCEPERISEESTGDITEIS